jgi:hypothetical protein
VAGWKNYFTQLWNVHRDNDVRHTEIHTAGPLAPESSAFEVDMAIEKLKRYRSPGIDQLPAAMIKTDFSVRSVNYLILFRIKRNCLSSRWSQSLYLFIRRVTKQVVVIITAYHSYQLHTKFYQISFYQG